MTHIIEALEGFVTSWQMLITSLKNMAMSGNFLVVIVIGAFYRCPNTLVRGHSI